MSRNLNEAAVVVGSVLDVLFCLRDTSFMWAAHSVGLVLTWAKVATRKTANSLLALSGLVCT